ncbi:transposase domain-containing protein [Streptomyces sp. NPDC055966]|uniref:transposase domain-containing protein n=1 Tax=Streptomyces sp. NPDC055966 TaxID=3345669 RepID=UPI0035E0B76D
MPCEPADAVLTAARTVQRRLRHLPPRVGYFLFAMCLFPEVGYRPVRDELTAGPAWRRAARSCPYGTVSFDGSQRVPDSGRTQAWLVRTSHHGCLTPESMMLVETGSASRLLHVLGPGMLPGEDIYGR